MAAIFISYRRADAEGHAGRLADKLEPIFGKLLFFDQNSIDYGSDFPDVLQREATECRVMLAVIAPNWIETLKQRAQQPDTRDWVLEELSIALSRPQETTVVPVLVGGATLPAEGALPAALRTLRNKELCTLSGKWSNIDGLVRTLKTRVSAVNWRSAATAASTQSVPIDLVYLCDRTPQEDAFLKTLSAAAPGPAAPYYLIVLHGHRWDAHSGFIERLKSTGHIEACLPGHWSGVGLDHHNIEFNWAGVKAGDYREALCTALAKKILPKPIGDIEAICSHLRTARRPLLFTLSVTSDQFAAIGDGLLDGLAEAWKTVAEQVVAGAGTVQSVPAILCCYVKYNKADDPHQKTVEKFEPAPPPLTGKVLPPLTPVQRVEAEDWADSDPVRSFVGKARIRVMNLFDDESYAENGGVRMQRFAEAVYEILNPS